MVFIALFSSGGSPLLLRRLQPVLASIATLAYGFGSTHVGQWNYWRDCRTDGELRWIAPKAKRKEDEDLAAGREEAASAWGLGRRGWNKRRIRMVARCGPVYTVLQAGGTGLSPRVWEEKQILFQACNLIIAFS
jgi:hypothetical protein